MTLPVIVVSVVTVGLAFMFYLFGYVRGFESCNRIYRETHARERLKTAAHNHAARV